MPPALDKIAQEFRAAVLAGDHALAERLACEYSNELRDLWQSLPDSDRAISGLPAQASELLMWGRGMAIVQRAMLAEQLAVLEKSLRYTLGQGVNQLPTIRMSL